MFQRLPRPVEIALIALMALFCAAVVAISPRKDNAIFFASVPLFLVCTIMGFRRSEQRSKPVDAVAEREAFEEVG